MVCETAIISTLYLPCEVGQRLTNAFNEITDRFEQLDWNLFPIEIQRLLPTIKMNTHVPIQIDCFGVFDGSREQFKRVKLYMFDENSVQFLCLIMIPFVAFPIGGQYRV